MVPGSCSEVTENYPDSRTMTLTTIFLPQKAQSVESTEPTIVACIYFKDNEPVLQAAVVSGDDCDSRPPPGNNWGTPTRAFVLDPCPSGFVINDGLRCENINECALGIDNCDPFSTCTDENPDNGAPYICTCNAGFEGNGYTCSKIHQ